MAFYSDNPEKLKKLGFPSADDPSEAEAVVLFSLSDAPDRFDRPCFVVAEACRPGFFDAVRLAFAGALVVRDAAHIYAMLDFIKKERADIETFGGEVVEQVEEEFESPSADEEPRFEAEERQEPESPEPWLGYAAGQEVAEDPPREPERPAFELPREPEKPALKSPPAREFVLPEVGLPNLIASYSPSTSVGKTFVAVNAAAWLASRGVRVALVDLDPDKADLWRTSYMEVFGPPQLTVSNWHDVEDPVRYVAHSPELPTLFVIPGTTVVGGRLPDAGEVAEILQVLAANFDAVVTDLNAMLRLSHVTVALRLAGKVLLVSDLSDKCVAQTSMIFSQASSVVGREKMSLVVNKVKRGQIYRSRDVAKMFGFPEFSEVPEDVKAVNNCLKRRRFPVTDSSALGKALASCFEKELAGYVPAREIETTLGRRFARFIPAPGFLKGWHR